MRECQSCSAPLADEVRFCATCGAPVELADQPTGFDPDLTVAAITASAVTAAGSHAPRTPPSSSPSSGSAWLSSPSDGVHGRFEPGTLLAGRYRIVDRKGQGGMGEVYRADDLKLGQPVALKFLPATLEADPVRLAQFHSEVRLARQVAHKNVCRMYDVGEVDGLPFLTMEYVDGEDLASLLRRIGRLPEDKALDLARQMCAGLAAAHERGILHRDLKPANVMIDGEGKVRITDFGLAAVAGAAGQSRAGTPAYMAPELLAGKDASVASDIYALGLVFYELFTGRRAFVASSIADLIRQQSESQLTSPTSLVKDLDPAIEQTILRTLAREPERRPSSALAVAASLPGGDPLAAALAAGETPSPEMVAAAGEQRRLTTPYAIAGTCAVIAALIACAYVSVPRRTLARSGLDKPPEVLLDRAEQVRETLGYSRTPNRWWDFTLDTDLVGYSNAHPEISSAGDVFTGRPGVLRFAERSSPRVLVPSNPVTTVSLGDPPFEVSGMTEMLLDTQGRLLTLHVVPPQRDSSVDTTVPDWSPLFRLAGLDQSAFRETTPAWLPRGASDARAAWEGPMPGLATPVRVEMAAWRGRPVYFQVITPWTRADRMEETPVGHGARILNGLAVAATAFLIISALVVARMNVRTGRGDWSGAWRIAGIAVVAQLVTWTFNDPHVGDPSVEMQRFFASIGEALFAGGLLFVMYLAVEPAVRRYWPDGLLGWTRLLQGRFVDARVGRDVLIGLAAGALMQGLYYARDPLQWMAGAHYPAASFGNMRYFEGVRYVLGYFTSLLGYQAIFAAMWCIFAIVGLKRLLGRTPVVFAAAVVAFTFINARELFLGGPGFAWINVIVTFAMVAILALVAMYVGLLATAAAFLATFVLSATPWTFDSTAWYFPQSMTALLFLCGLAAFCGYAVGAPAAPAPRPSAVSG